MATPVQIDRNTYQEAATAKRVFLVDASGNYVDASGGGSGTTQYALRLDDAGSGVTYVGEAVVGTATSAASWRIKRITEASGDLTIEWADSDSNFDNVWDNRASLTYG